MKKKIFSSSSVASGYSVMENTLCPCGFLEQQLKACGGSVLQGSCIAVLSTSSPPGIPKNAAPAAPAACYHPVICRVGASSPALFLAPSRRRLLWVPDVEERSRLSLLRALPNFLGFSVGCAAGRQLFVTKAPHGLSHCTAPCCFLKSPSEAPGNIGSRIFFGTRLPGSPPR